jgi:hypothetical protein
MNYIRRIITIILILSFGLLFIIPNNYLNMPIYKYDSIYTVNIQINSIIWTDASGDVTTFSGVGASHNPIDISIIDENAQMSIINVSFVGTPASGTTSGWFYIYALDIDKNHDNATSEYSVQFFKMVGGSPACSITRASDNYYWDGKGWRSSSYSDPSFIYITGNNMIFNFSSCPDLIDSNWYNIDARFTTGTSGFIDLGIGGVGTGPMYFAGKSSGQDKNPPQIINPKIIPSVGLSGANFIIKVNVSDPSNVSSAVAFIKASNETVIQTISLFDDGIHFDGSASDSLFGNSWNSFGQPNGTYYVDIWANDTCGNSIRFEDAKFFLIGAVAKTGLFDGLYYNWTGRYYVGTSGSWHGSERYHFLEGNIYMNNHYDSQNGPDDWLSDNATRILTTKQPFWGTNVHDHMFISLNTSLNEEILINIAGADKIFTVAGTAYMGIFNSSIECWKLTDSGGSVLFYDKTTGLLINGTYRLGMGFYYTIILNTTNALFRIFPKIAIIQPENKTYLDCHCPIVVANFTNIESAWYRQSTTGITWSNNYSLIYNGNYFINNSCKWENGSNIIQLFANNSFGNVIIKILWFTIKILPPIVSIDSPLNITYNKNVIDINLSSPSADLDTLWYRLYNGTHGITGNVTWYLGSSIILPDGIYCIFAWGNNSFGSISLPVNITFTIDVTAPKITIISPENITYHGCEILINLSSSATDLSKIWYRIYSISELTWIDLVNINWNIPTKRSLPDGSYMLYIWANDTFGNECNIPGNINFIVDAPPQITSISIINGTVSSTGNLVFNISISAADLDTIWYRILNGETWITANITWTQAVILQLGNGNYLIYIWVNDTQGNKGSYMVSFSVQIFQSHGLDYYIWIIFIVIGVVAGLAIFYRVKKLRKKKMKTKGTKEKDTKSSQNFADRVIPKELV